MNQDIEKRLQAVATELLEALGMRSNVHGYERCLNQAMRLIETALEDIRRDRRLAARLAVSPRSPGPAAEVGSDQRYSECESDDSFDQLARCVYLEEKRRGAERQAVDLLQRRGSLDSLKSEIDMRVKHHEDRAKGGARNRKYDHEMIRELDAKLNLDGIDNIAERNELIRRELKRKELRADIGSSQLYDILKEQRKKQGVK